MIREKFDCFYANLIVFYANLIVFYAIVNDLTHIWMFLHKFDCFLRKSDCFYVNVIVFDANLNGSKQIWLYHSNLINCTQMWLFFDAHLIVFRRTFDCIYANLISGSRWRRIFGLETDGRDPAPRHARLPHSAGLRLDGAHPGCHLRGHWGQTGCGGKECKHSLSIATFISTYVYVG